MKIKESDKDIQFTKMPRIVIHFMYCYIGGFGLVSVMDAVNAEYMFFKILMLVICSLIFSYGFISLKEDYKSGGFAKIRDKFNSKK